MMTPGRGALTALPLPVEAGAAAGVGATVAAGAAAGAGVWGAVDL